MCSPTRGKAYILYSLRHKIGESRTPSLSSWTSCLVLMRCVCSTDQRAWGFFKMTYGDVGHLDGKVQKSVVSWWLAKAIQWRNTVLSTEGVGTIRHWYAKKRNLGPVLPRRTQATLKWILTLNVQPWHCWTETCNSPRDHGAGQTAHMHKSKSTIHRRWSKANWT